MTARLSLSLLLVAACGGGASSGPVDQATAEDYCRQGCEYEVDCGTETDVELCTSSCVSDLTGVIREDALIDITECFTALECTADDDVCFLECTPTGTHEDYEVRCRAELGTCDLTADQINGICEVSPNINTDAGFLCLIAPPIIVELDTCLDQPDCTARLTCMQAVYESYGLNG